MRRPFARLASALALIAWVAAAFPASLDAHQTLRTSQPARGAVLAEPPRVLRLTFVEPVDLALTRLVLRGPGGDTIALRDLRLHPDSAAVLVADIAGAQPAGLYRLDWATVGRDGHAVNGSIAYSVQSGDVPVRPTAPSGEGPTASTPVPMPIPADDAGRSDAEVAGGAGPLAVAAQWFRLVALLLVIGSAASAVLLLRDRSTPAGTGGSAGAGGRARAPGAAGGPATASPFLPGAPARAALIGLIAALVVLASALVRLRFQLADVAAVAPDASSADRATLVLRSYWGIGWMLELAGAAAAIAGFAFVRRTGRGWWLAVVGALVLAAAAAASGHSAAGVLPALTVPLDALHVLGVAGWLGTLALLVVVAIPSLLRLPAAERGGMALQLFRAFSPFALSCAAIVVATGVAAAALHLGTPGALWATTYGRTLLVKIGAVIALVALGAWNWKRATPRLTSDPDGLARFRRSASVEVGVAALIVLVTAALILTPLPRP